MKRLKNAHLNIFIMMAHIGLIGFGGGNALIPVIQNIAVDKNHVIEKTEFDEDIVVASITPGALPVELAGGIGKRIGGRRWMLLCASAMALSGSALTVVLLSVISIIDGWMLMVLKFVSIGITAFVCMLLFDYIIETFQKPLDGGIGRVSSIGIAGLVFILTCEKSLYKILESERTPLFGMSAVQVFGMAFTVLAIASVQRIKNKRDILLGIKYSCVCRSVILDAICMVGVVLVAAMLVFPLKEQGLKYIGEVFLSSIMSFGGGDSYLTVADGLFVGSELITEEQFYGSIVPLVNILPGSILCKTVSGIGYYVGIKNGGTLIYGYLTAIAGFLCSIAASCGTFAIVWDIYHCASDMWMFQTIKKWIRPIVSGLMGTVMLSIINQLLRFGETIEKGHRYVVVTSVIVLLDLQLYKRLHMGNVVLVLMSVGISILMCGVYV